VLAYEVLKDGKHVVAGGRDDGRKKARKLSDDRLFSAGFERVNTRSGDVSELNGTELAAGKWQLHYHRKSVWEREAAYKQVQSDIPQWAFWRKKFKQCRVGTGYFTFSL
jgi:hypothetical protein